jgi:hypothetical protein
VSAMLGSVVEPVVGGVLGLVLGTLLCVATGELVGSIVGGCVTGVEVGTGDSEFVGEEDGRLEGPEVGEKGFGAPVGMTIIAVGRWVGIAVDGCADGLTVGKTEGPGVGMN